MKTSTLTALAVVTIIALGALFRGGGPSRVEASSGDAAAEQLRLIRVERGKYIVSTAGCHDCHTPMKLGSRGPEPDMSRALSGHPEHVKLPPAPPASGPWKIAVAKTMTA